MRYAVGSGVLVDGRVGKKLRTLFGQHYVDSGHGRPAFFGPQNLHYGANGASVLHSGSGDVGVCMPAAHHHRTVVVAVVHQAARFLASHPFSLAKRIKHLGVVGKIGRRIAARINHRNLFEAEIVLFVE